MTKTPEIYWSVSDIAVRLGVTGAAASAAKLPSPARYALAWNLLTPSRRGHLSAKQHRPLLSDSGHCVGLSFLLSLSAIRRRIAIWSSTS